MPTLQFKGKHILWNHHLTVPYHALEAVPELSFQSEKADGSLILEGDNLLALKALLPLYGGRVKCIYIDPPYNTGNEAWAYNDNVNSPLMKDWLGREVGKDDLTRHDKWLCMMTPRLKLLRDLLAEDGVIFVSIDDNELHHLRCLMDEIFGEGNFRNIIQIRRGIKSVQAQFETIDRLNFGAEYVLVYTREENFRFETFEIELENAKPGGWNNHWRGTDRPTMRYPLFGIAPESGQWRWSEARSQMAIENYKELLREVGGDGREITQEEIDAWTMRRLAETGEEIDLLRLSNTGKPEHYVPPSETRLASSLWLDLKPNGSSQLKAVFGRKAFDTPKSVDLIKRLVRFAEGSRKDSIVLDSFAGSGATAQAVMELNAEDGGQRKFILVQMSEASPKEPDKNICRDITRERAKRAIQKFGFESGFDYQRVGISLDPENMLAGSLPTPQQLGAHLFYLCSGAHPAQPVEEVAPDVYFAGYAGPSAVYFVYRQDYETLTRLALNLNLAEGLLQRGAGRAVVYAPACFLDEDFLREKQIEYVNLPYGMFRRGAE